MNALLCPTYDAAALAQAAIDTALGYPRPGVQLGGTTGRLVRVDAEVPGPGWSLHAVPVLPSLTGDGSAALALDDAAEVAWAELAEKARREVESENPSELASLLASLPPPEPLPAVFVPAPMQPKKLSAHAPVVGPTVPPKGLTRQQMDELGMYSSDPRVAHADPSAPVPRRDFDELAADFRGFVKEQREREEQHAERHGRELEANLSAVRNIADNVHTEFVSVRAQLAQTEKAASDARPRARRPWVTALVATALVAAPLAIRGLEMIFFHH